MRLLIGIFAIIVFTYWAITKKPEQSRYFTWKYLHPLFRELIVIFAMTVLLLETEGRYHPVLWTAGSVLLIFSGKTFYKSVPRLRFYSIIFHWIALFNIAFVLIASVVPSVSIFDRRWFIGTMAIVIQFIYIIYFYKYNDLDNIYLPPALSGLKPVVGFLLRHRNKAIYYPFFISIAIFIRRSFLVSIHTLLWVAEAFAIFIVSVLLKENHFRYLSMAVLGVCLVRLMLYDLAQTGTITKGIVFVCVGLIMLAMNVVYNKYRNRF